MLKFLFTKRTLEGVYNLSHFLASLNSFKGMESGELASSVSKSPCVWQALTPNLSPSSKLALAVNLYAIESRTLLQQSMLLAGFNNTHVAEWSAQEIQVALELYDVESKRLCKLMGCTVACEGCCLKKKRAMKRRKPGSGPQEKTSTPRIPSGNVSSATGGTS
jgi:hypothetical protein